MANNYTTLTLLADVPTVAISNLHRVLLEAMGFGLEESDPDQTYIYAEDPHLHLDGFDGDEETSFTAEDRQSEL